MTIATLQAAVSVPIDRWRDGRWSGEDDRVASEVPVALEYNGISHTVMLASPGDLDDFALGFSLTEGIVSHRRQLYDMEEVVGPDGIELRMTIASERFVLLKDHRRSMAGRTGCGLCGAESLDQVFRAMAPVGASVTMSAEAVQTGLDSLNAQQFLQRQTGATHAAAWLGANGRVGPLREDVGRHNALDKLIGALARTETDPAGGAVIVTSRASYEMVQKTAAMGIGILIAVSAPTSLAIRMAADLNLTLAGFARPGSFGLYTHPERIRGLR